MKKTPILFSLVTAAGWLAASPTTKAAVVLNSSFTFDLIGAGYTGAGAAYIVVPTAATFNSLTPTTVTGPNGQTISLTSSEAVNALANTTTDTFTISTPTNFLTTMTIGTGTTTISLIQFDIGDSNSGGDPVMLGTAIASASATGNFTFGTGTTQTITNPTFTLASDGMSYSGAEGVNTGSATTAISTDAVHGFTYSVTYATVTGLVPEPSTWAMLGIGAIGSALVMSRRRVA